MRLLQGMRSLPSHLCSRSRTWCCLVSHFPPSPSFSIFPSFLQSFLDGPNHSCSSSAAPCNSHPASRFCKIQLHVQSTDTLPMDMIIYCKYIRATQTCKKGAAALGCSISHKRLGYGGLARDANAVSPISNGTTMSPAVHSAARCLLPSLARLASAVGKSAAP